VFSHLDVEAYDREYSDLTLAKRAARYFAPHRRAVAVVVASVAALASLGAGVPMLIAQGVDMLGGRREELLDALGVAVLLAGVLVWAVNYLRRRLTVAVIGDIVLALRRDAFRAAVHHDMSFYDRYSSGRVVTRITSDTNDFGQTVVLITELVSQILVMMILAAVLWSISPRLTVILLAWAPVVVVLAAGFRRVARYVTRQGARAMAEVNAKVFETVSGIAVAKNFRREAAIWGEFTAVNRLSYRINVRRGLVLATVFPVLNILVGIGTATIVYAGGLEAVGGAIALGAWFLFIQSLDRFWFPLINLAAFTSQVQAGLAAIERVFALIDYVSPVVQQASVLVPRLQGHIRFSKVVLRYSDDVVVLPGLDLEIHPGESVALVGATGAGKTSVARLVARFYEFQGGAITIDGRDIRTLDLASYRRHLGIVPQTPYLKSGTVADNIRYARPEVSDAEILAMTRRIGDGEWLAALPRGLDTEVGERGSRLSMGQRQLIALMRVLMQRPAVFILDEATASVDPFTEAQIQDALDLLLRGSTSLVIAHRLSTVQASDRIIVLDHGRIQEEGSHGALLAAKGHYARLYDRYFRHQSPDYVPGAGRRSIQQEMT